MGVSFVDNQINTHVTLRAFAFALQANGVYYGKADIIGLHMYDICIYFPEK